MAISSIRVETWTRDEDGAGTDGSIQCTIQFLALSPLIAILDQPGVNNFRRGGKDIIDIPIGSPHQAAQPTDISAIELRNLDAGRTWKIRAVGLAINGVVLLSRVVWNQLPPDVVVLPINHDGTLEGIQLKIRTANVKRADSDDPVFCTIRLKDGRQIASDLPLSYPGIDEFERGVEHNYLIPLPSDPLWGAKPEDIAEIAIRKEGSNGWLLGGVRLYGNGILVFQNDKVDQFLDSASALLRIRHWSSERVVGPVLGGIGSNFARVQYRVERPGVYALRVQDLADGTVVEQLGDLAPAGVIQASDLRENRTYDFLLTREGSVVQGSGGSFTTFPLETTGGRFAFAFGSCLRNRFDIVQTVWAQMRRLAHEPNQSANRKDAFPLRFFLHLGDTFYFYDSDVLKAANSDLDTVGDAPAAARAAHLSSRLNPNFLELAKVLPSVAVWDDHDFGANNSQSQGFAAANQVRDEFLRYWGNPDLGWQQFGLASRMTYGKTDIYLMDGRFKRVKSGSNAALFSKAQCDHVLAEIEKRGRELGGRLVGLASGSPWNGMDSRDTGEAYNDPIFAQERKHLFDGLRAKMDSGRIQGLFLLSGDIHRHEVYEVSLGGRRVAPEFICSPLCAPNGAKDASSITGERKFSQGVEPENGLYAGFSTVIIDNTATEPNGHWTLSVKYRRYDDGAVFFSHRYKLSNNEFRF